MPAALAAPDTPSVEELVEIIGAEQPTQHLLTPLASSWPGKDGADDEDDDEPAARTHTVTGMTWSGEDEDEGDLERPYPDPQPSEPSSRVQIIAPTATHWPPAPDDDEGDLEQPYPAPPTPPAPSS
jgi:hypothetical protein